MTNIIISTVIKNMLRGERYNINSIQGSAKHVVLVMCKGKARQKKNRMMLIFWIAERGRLDLKIWKY